MAVEATLGLPRVGTPVAPTWATTLICGAVVAAAAGVLTSAMVRAVAATTVVVTERRQALRAAPAPFGDVLFMQASLGTTDLLLMGTAPYGAG